MKYYILNPIYANKDVFLRIEDLAFEKATENKFVLFYVNYSDLMDQIIYINLN